MQSKQMFSSIFIRFLIYFAHWMNLAHLPVLLKGNHFSDIEIGIAISLYSLSSMLLMLPMGAFSDFFSPKRTMLAGTLCFALSFTGLLLFSSFWAIVTSVLLGGFGVAALIVVSESLYLKLFGQKERGRRIAFYQLSTYLGFGLGPLAGGFLVSSSANYLFLTAIGICIAIFIVGLHLPDSTPIDFHIKQYSDDLKQPKALLLTACIFMIGTHFGVEQTSLSLLMNDLDFSAKIIGLVFTCIGLWMAITVPFIGRLHDKKDSVFIFLLVGMAISGVFQSLTAYTTSLQGLLLVRLLHTFGDAVALLELSVLVALFFPSARLGGNSGFMYAVRTSATFIAALLAGIINRSFGYDITFLSNGFLMLAFVMACTVFIIMDKKRMAAVGWKKNDR